MVDSRRSALLARATIGLLVLLPLAGLLPAARSDTDDARVWNAWTLSGGLAFGLIVYGGVLLIALFVLWRERRLGRPDRAWRGMVLAFALVGLFFTLLRGVGVLVEGKISSDYDYTATVLAGLWVDLLLPVITCVVALLSARSATGVAVAINQAAWYPDPTGRFAHRYFDGQTWSAQVVDHGGKSFADPLAPAATVERSDPVEPGSP